MDTLRCHLTLYYLPLLILFSVITARSDSKEAHLIRTAIDHVNIDTLLQTVRALSGEVAADVDGQSVVIQSRHRSQPGNPLAARYLLGRFRNYGLAPQIHSYGTTGENVVAVQNGTRFPNRFFIICAHYDAMPSGLLSHGADDNASGVACVLECARLLVSLSLPYSVIYALWDEEEVGLLGSRNYAYAAAVRGDSILGVINLDMIAYDGNNDAVANVLVRPIASSIDIGERLLDINSNFQVGLRLITVNPGSSSSDHAAFWENAYSAVMLIEDYYRVTGFNDFNPFYHSVKDRIELDGVMVFNEPYFRRCVQVGIGSLLSYALDAGPAPPLARATEATGHVRTTFSWHPSERAKTYWVQMASNPSFTEIAFENKAVSDTFWVPQRLGYNTLYNWRARACNQAGSSSWSAAQEFQTIDAVSHTVHLHSGWNLVSTPVAADDSTLISLLADTSTMQFMLRDGKGAGFAPALGIAERTLWNNSEGYWLYAAKQGGLAFRGWEINTAPTPMALTPGWHILPYWSTDSMAIAEAFDSISDHLLILKDEAGGVFWPEQGIDQIGSLCPGKAYQAFLEAADTLCLPVNESSLEKPLINRGGMPAASSHYPLVANTGANAIALLDVPDLRDGDEVGVWAGGRMLVGAGMVRQGKTLITIWGDDVYTPGAADGALPGESLSITVWSSATQSERPVILNQLYDGLTGASLPPAWTFSTDAVWRAVLPNAAEAPTSFTLAQNYPNPFNLSTILFYQVPIQSRIRLVIYNARGQEVAVLVDGVQRSGYYPVPFSASDWASGIYWAMLFHTEGQEKIKMLLVR